jgi:transketolase
MYKAYSAKFPEEAADINRRIAGKLPDGWEKALPTFTVKDEAVASRKLSESILGKLSVVLPEFVSGSADLTPSNLTVSTILRSYRISTDADNLQRWKNAVDFQPAANGLGDYSGKYIRYGVREHAMGASECLSIFLQHSY